MNQERTFFSFSLETHTNLMEKLTDFIQQILLKNAECKDIYLVFGATIPLLYFQKNDFSVSLVSALLSISLDYIETFDYDDAIDSIEINTGVRRCWLLAFETVMAVYLSACNSKKRKTLMENMKLYLSRGRCYPK